MISITSVMAMPCYLMCTLFLWKVAVKEPWKKGEGGIRFSRTNGLVTGIVGTVFALYLVYAAGLNYLMIAAFVYAIGIPLFIIGRKQAGQTGSILGYFTKWEKVLCVAVIILGIVGIIYSISSGVFTA